MRCERQDIDKRVNKVWKIVGVKAGEMAITRVDASEQETP
jgi:hypothetical protein